MATQASSSSSEEIVPTKFGGKDEEEDEAEKENRRRDPCKTQDSATAAASSSSSSELMDKTRDLSSQQSQLDSQNVIGPTQQSSESSVEPNSSASPALNTSKVSSQLSSCGDLDLQLESTQDPSQMSQSVAGTSSRERPGGSAPSFAGFSQEKVENETEYVDSTSQDSPEWSQSLLPGLGSTPSAKRAATSTPELVTAGGEEGGTPQKKARREEEEEEKEKEESVNDIFDISDEDEKEKGVADDDGENASASSIVIESPSPCADKRSNKAINDRADDSVVILGEITSRNGEGAAAEIVDISNDSVKSRELPQLRMPQPRSSFSENNGSRNQEQQDCSSNSESPFYRLTRRQNDEEEPSPGPLQQDEVSANNASADQESSSLVVTRGSLNSSEPVSVASPDFAASPIEHAAADMNRPGQKRPRISSTPGFKATKKSSALAGKVVSSPSDEEVKDSSSKRRRSSPTKLEEFKKPKAVETYSHVLLGGKDGLNHEQVESLRKSLANFRVAFDVLTVPHEKVASQYSAIQNFNHSFVSSSPENPVHPLRPNRLSDASTASSSLSRSSSASGGGGYLADGSGASSLSGGSKRDRLSILPETSIEPHTVVSPLPGATRKVQVRKTREYRTRRIGGDQKAASDRATVVDSGAKCDGAKPAEAGVEGNLPRCVAAGAATSGPPSKPRQDDGGAVVAAVADSQGIRLAVTTDIQKGCAVFAKYIERTQYRYWPAMVDSPVSEDKWIVKFDDGKERTLPNDELIPMSALVPGHAVSVILRNEEAGVSHAGVLNDYPCKNEVGKICCPIKFDHIEGIAHPDQETVLCDDMFLTAEQARGIKRDLGGRWMTPIVSKADLDLSNIVSGTRIRQRPQSFAASPMKSSTPSSTPAKKKKGGEWVESSTVETSDAETTEKTSKKMRSRRILTSTDDEKEGQQAPAKTRKRGRKNVKVTNTLKDPLFKDMTFILTQGTRKANADPNIAMETETEEEEDSERDQSFSEGPNFNRKELVRKIAENGGKVLNSFPSAKQKIPEDLIVVSDQHCQTMNFLSAIAYGVPKVNFLWVLNSVDQKSKQNLKNYYLPNGFSSTRNKIIEHHEIGALTTMLKGKNVLVTSKNSAFLEDWDPLVTRLGASVSSRSSGKFDRSLKTIDVVLADHDSPSGILTDAGKREIPVVTPSWIVQSLINGIQLGTDNFLVHKENK